MANHMIGNTSFYLIKPELTFGVLNATASASDIVLGLKVDFKYNPNIINRPLHTGQLTDVTCNYIFASADATVTIDAAFSPDYKVLIDGYLQTTLDSIGTPSSFGTASKSFTIIHLDSQNPTKCRYATGCTVKSINISGTSKDYMKMTVELPAVTMTDWVVRPAISGSYPTGPTCHEPYKFADMLSLAIDASSITINMDSELIEDSVRYGASFTPVNNIMTKKMISLNYETLFDPTSVTTPIAGINTIESYDIKFTNTTAAINFVINGNLTNYTLADPDSGVWKNSYETNAVKDNSNAAITIAYTA